MYIYIFNIVLLCKQMTIKLYIYKQIYIYNHIYLYIRIYIYHRFHKHSQIIFTTLLHIDDSACVQQQEVRFRHRDLLCLGLEDRGPSTVWVIKLINGHSRILNWRYLPYIS